MVSFSRARTALVTVIAAISIMSVSIFSIGAAFAAEAISIAPDSSVLLFKIKPLEVFPLTKIKDAALLDKIKKAFDQTKEKSGVDLAKDVTEVLVYMNAIDFPTIALGGPLVAVIVVKGKFDVKGIEDRIAKKNDPGVKKEKIGKGNIYTVDETSFSPMDAETLLIGPSALVKAAIEPGKAKSVKDSKEWAALLEKGQFAKASFFCALVFPASVKSLIDGLKDPKARVFASLENAVLGGDSQTTTISLKFKDKAGAQAAMVVLEESLKEAKGEVEKNKLEREFPKEVLDKAREVRVMKAGMELGSSLVKNTELAIKENEITAKVTMAGLSENVDIMIEDWLANTADMFLEKPEAAKTPSEGAADPNKELCEANMCMLEGASDLYLMDQTMEVNVVKVDALVKDDYMRKAPECPVGGQYSITVTQAGPKITCTKHGDLR
jgi:hypothetical protein